MTAQRKRRGRKPVSALAIVNELLRCRFCLPHLPSHAKRLLRELRAALKEKGTKT